MPRQNGSMENTNDPTRLIESLDAGELRQRLRDLDHQQRALRVLLRAALARDRESTISKSLTTREVRRDSR